MVKIHDLTGIAETKRKRVVECLDSLLTIKDDSGIMRPVITGYNFYNSLPISDTSVTFSNIHGTEEYKQDMLRDLEKLGYDPRRVLEQIRNKGGTFLWDLDFIIRGQDGNLLPGVIIKDVRNAKYLELEKFPHSTIDNPELSGHLIGEDFGWEVNIPFFNIKDLLELVNLFARKSGIFIYDDDGTIVNESWNERTLRGSWTDAYKVPVLLLGETAIKYSKILPHFVPVTKISLIDKSNEISYLNNNN